MDPFAFGIALVFLTSPVACIVSTTVGVKVVGSSSTPLPSVSPWRLSPRPSRASSRSPSARDLGHRRHETARLVIFGFHRPRRCPGVAYLARRVHRLDHRRHERVQLVVDSVALGITLVPPTSTVACIVSTTVGVRALGSSFLDFFALRIALVSLTLAVACFVACFVPVAVGMRVLGSSSVLLPSISSWCLPPLPSRASP